MASHRDFSFTREKIMSRVIVKYTEDFLFNKNNPVSLRLTNGDLTDTAVKGS